MSEQEKGRGEGKLHIRALCLPPVRESTGASLRLHVVGHQYINQPTNQPTNQSNKRPTNQYAGASPRLPASMAAASVVNLKSAFATHLRDDINRR